MINDIPGLTPCPYCDHKYERKPPNPEGFTLWTCPKCGREERIHITPRNPRKCRDDEEK